jgi:glycine betaine/choline ABC-type transport system substrate-binding protein
VDVIVANSTDPLIEKYHLHVFKDDRLCFKRYQAIVLTRDTIPSFKGLANTVTETKMRQANLAFVEHPQTPLDKLVKLLD